MRLEDIDFEALHRELLEESATYGQLGYFRVLSVIARFADLGSAINTRTSEFANEV